MESELNVCDCRVSSYIVLIKYICSVVDGPQRNENNIVENHPGIFYLY